MPACQHETTPSIMPEQDEALKTPLPCDIVIGSLCFTKGTALGAFVAAAQRWQRIATARLPHPSDIHLSPAARWLHAFGADAAREGERCQPPARLTLDEQRQWAIGWIETVRAAHDVKDLENDTQEPPPHDFDHGPDPDTAL